MSSWRVAPAAKALLKQADLIAPHRDRSRDGTIGDSSHAARRSDHNPTPDGWVYASDLTGDVRAGIDCREIARQIVARRDRRVKYLIHEGRMVSSYPATVNGVRYPAWTSRPYNGPNGHFAHLHLSVVAQWRNDTSPWWTPSATSDEEELDVDENTLRRIIGEEIDKRVTILLRGETGGKPSGHPDHLKSLSERLGRIEKALGAGS